MRAQIPVTDRIGISNAFSVSLTRPGDRRRERHKLLQRRTDSTEHNRQSVLQQSLPPRQLALLSRLGFQSSECLRETRIGADPLELRRDLEVLNQRV